MAQFDVYRNLSKNTKLAIPYFLDIQSDVLDIVITRVVVPLILVSAIGKPAKHLNPVFKIEGKQVMMLTQELAGISNQMLEEKVLSLANHRHEIIHAIDFLFTGV